MKNKINFEIIKRVSVSATLFNQEGDAAEREILADGTEILFLYVDGKISCYYVFSDSDEVIKGPGDFSEYEILFGRYLLILKEQKLAWFDFETKELYYVGKKINKMTYVRNDGCYIFFGHKSVCRGRDPDFTMVRTLVRLAGEKTLRGIVLVRNVLFVKDGEYFKPFCTGKVALDEIKFSDRGLERVFTRVVFSEEDAREGEFFTSDSNYKIR